MKKNISFSNISNIIKINFNFLIIIIFPFISSFSLNNLNNYYSEITLKLKGKGIQKIINFQNTNAPDKVYLNNEKIVFSKDGHYISINIDEEKEENIIILIWESNINSLYAIFQKISILQKWIYLK